MTPEVRDSLRAFVDELAPAPDPWFLALRGLPEVAGTRLDMRHLLLAVFGQELAPVPLGRVLAALEDFLGEDLPRASHLPYARLQEACCAVPGLGTWKHALQAPGILLSCSDYLQGIPSLNQRIASLGPAAFVRDMAGEIPFAGRVSPWRLRPWRLARWLVRGELGPGIPEHLSTLHVPPAVLARTWRFLRWPVPPDDLPVRTQGWSDRICRELFPDDPARVWVPLTLLRRPKIKVWACEDFRGGCGDCVLRKPCNPPGRV